jgi:hypothetical protein
MSITKPTESPAAFIGIDGRKHIEFAPDERIGGWPNVGDLVRVYLPWDYDDDVPYSERGGERIWAVVVGVDDKGYLRVEINNRPLDPHWKEDQIISVRHMQVDDVLMLRPVDGPKSRYEAERDAGNHGNQQEGK